MRERDGLAMSSRNQYLSARERQVGSGAFRVPLQLCRERLLAGDRNFESIRRQAVRHLRRAGFRPDYVEIRNAADLSAAYAGIGNLRVLAAARLGRARLIDNVAVRLR